MCVCVCVSVQDYIKKNKEQKDNNCKRIQEREIEIIITCKKQKSGTKNYSKLMKSQKVQVDQSQAKIPNLNKNAKANNMLFIREISKV